MRKFFVFSIILSILILNFSYSQQVSQCLIDNNIVGNNCNPIGDPYIEGNCIVGVQNKSQEVSMLNL